MAISCTPLTTPVKATVTESFRAFAQGEEVVINRVAGQALMFGVAGQFAFIPPNNVDEKAREEVVRLYNAAASQES